MDTSTNTQMLTATQVAGGENGTHDARGFTKKHVRGYDPRLLVRGKRKGGTTLVHLHHNGTVFDEDGYDYYGRDIDGYDREGWSAGGYDRDGYNAEGVSPMGWLRDGTNKWTGTRFDSQGRDRDGYFEDGYNAEGYDRNERDRQGKLPVFSFAEIKRRYFVEGAPATLVEAAHQEPDGTWTPDADYKNLGVQRHVGRMNSVDLFFINPDGRESPIRLGKASDWSVNDDGHVVNNSCGLRLTYAIGEAAITRATQPEGAPVVETAPLAESTEEPKVFQRVKYPSRWRALSRYEVEDMIYMEPETWHPHLTEEFHYFIATHRSIKVLETAWQFDIIAEMSERNLHFLWKNRRVHEALYREDLYKGVASNPNAPDEVIEFILRETVFKETHEYARLAALGRPAIDRSLLEWKPRRYAVYVR